MVPYRKVAVTGASGMLGSAVVDRLARDHIVHANSRRAGNRKRGVHWTTFDVLVESALTKWLREVQPEAVIHCAAMVNVDQCEKEPANALAMHVETTATIAATLTQWDGRLIYISTDSVFNGRKEGLYTEEDETDPLNVYARSKREGELRTLSSPRGTVLRTNIFGWTRGDRTSFAEWVLKGIVERVPLTMFTDVNYTPIHVAHLAEVIEWTLRGEITGLFHATGSSVLSKFDFALKMASVFGLSAEFVVPTSVAESGLCAVRPRNMCLGNGKICQLLGYRLPNVEVGIEKMKAQYHDGYLAALRDGAVHPNYRFWETYE